MRENGISVSKIRYAEWAQALCGIYLIIITIGTIMALFKSELIVILRQFNNQYFNRTTQTRLRKPTTCKKNSVSNVLLLSKTVLLLA